MDYRPGARSPDHFVAPTPFSVDTFSPMRGRKDRQHKAQFPQPGFRGGLMSGAMDLTDKTTIPPYGERVMTLRAERGWSRLTLATKAGCSEGTIKRIEDGERTRPTTLVLIAKVFGMSPQELLGIEKNRHVVLEIKIYDHAFSTPSDAIIDLLKRIMTVIGDSTDIEVVSASRGSIKVRIALGPDEALRLLTEIDEGQLDECGIESASLEGPGEEYSYTSVAPLWQFGSESRDSVFRLFGAEDWVIREFAVRAIRRMGPTSVPALNELLRDPNPEIRGQAAFALGQFGPLAADAVPALTELLRDPNPEIRGQAATTLGSIGPLAADAVPTLIELLRDPDTGVCRKRAPMALMNIGKEATPALVGSLRHPDPEVRGQAARILGLIRPLAADAVPTLVGLINDPDPQVRGRAAFALGQFGPLAADAVPALVGLINDPDPAVCQMAAESLRMLSRGGDRLTIPDE